MPLTSPAYDKRWECFLVSSLMQSFRDEAEANFQNDVEDYKGAKLALKRAVELRKSLVSKKPSSEKSTLASANSFIREAAGELGSFLAGLHLIGRFRDGTTLSKEAKAVLQRNGRVESAMRYSEGRLRLVLPDLVGLDEHRWPGHVSYRAGLNHFVAVCLRVHSILPDVPFNVITKAAARRILVPALAHNLKFFAKQHPEVYRYFVYEDDLCLRRGKPLKREEIAASVPGESKYVARKWTRLFNSCIALGKGWGEGFLGELYVGLQTLLRDYEADPRSSQLWRDLSILAAGDMAVDEMLVSWVIEDVGGDPKSQASGPIINCARSRFGLLRYAYLMTKEAEEFRKDFDTGKQAADNLLELMKKTDEGTLSKEQVNQVFGWAYLLSRNNLIGRKSSEDSLSHRNLDLAGHLLFDLLNELRFKAASDTHRALALRYLIGFMTNPRFIKPWVKISADPRSRASAYSSGTVEELITDATKDKLIPQSIVLLAKARVALHHAYLHRKDSGRHAQELQSALDHYATILKVLDAPPSAGIMDGEVIAWALPEMYYAIEALKLHDPESEEDWRSVQNSLQVLGEMQYGVFFSAKEELERVEKGLQVAIIRPSAS